MKLHILKIIYVLIILAPISCKDKKDTSSGNAEPPDASAPQVINCAALKEGNFRMAFYANQYDTAIVSRKNGLQTEIYLGSKYEVTTRINWTDSCRYEITLVQANTADWNKDKGRKALVRIVEKKNDTVYFVSKFDDPALPEYAGWMVKTGE